MSQIAFTDKLLSFLQHSPTPFHAVQNMAKALEQGGFQSLDEGDKWNLEPGERYYITRNGSSIVAFVYGKADLANTGIRMSGAHTDSPCLKVKPHPEINANGYFQLGVEVYGGALLNPWFDRDLSLAGRVTYRDKSGELKNVLLDFARPVASIPSLAIHLDREANKNRTVNPQKDIPPVLMLAESTDQTDFRKILVDEISAQYPDLSIEDVLDYELSFYDCQPPSVVGLNEDFIASARLDNLLSCFVGLEALLAAGDGVTSLLVCNDHEEVGSASACGAQGPMLKSLIERLLPDVVARNRTLDRSMMVSADNAHGIHPNYSDRHDNNHGPQLNKGPVIKVNANQRYATNSETSAIFRHLCHLDNVPVQTFVTRTDMACGSTIGPITATELGVKALDVGVPTFAMHSIRELAGQQDAFYLYQVLTRFYQMTTAPGIGR